MGTAIIWPPKVTVTVWDGAKLEPVKVTDVETGPLLGDKERVGALTENSVDIELTLSVAVTLWPPAVDDGTANVAAGRLPVESAVTVFTVVASKVMVTWVPGLKLDPVTVTMVPMRPLLGLSVMEGAVTVNVAKPKLTPSLAFIKWGPDLTAGTVKFVLFGIVPFGVAVTVPTIEPSSCMYTVDFPRKLDPVIAIDAPIRPFVGFSEIWAVVTVKVVEAALELASVTVTVLAPEVADIVNVVPENEPEPSVVVVPARPMGDPPTVAIKLLKAANPEPETETIVPFDPLAGFRVIAGVTMKVV